MSRRGGPRGGWARWAAGALAAAVLTGASGCASAVGGAGSAAGGLSDRTPVTLHVSSFFTGREKGVVDHAMAAFHATHPWITIDSTGGQSDDSLLQSVRGGNPADVYMTADSASVASYCRSNVFQDLDANIPRDHVDTSQFIPATLQYVQSGGKICGFPMLSDVMAMYYDPATFAKAGISHPPRTWEELTQDAEKLTVRKPDGTIERAGFVPLFDFDENAASNLTQAWGLQWYHDGASSLATDPHWAQMLRWQKKLVDWYGLANLQRFVAGVGDEFSADNPFEVGKIAMVADGEWRTAFIKADNPKLSYDVAPLPSVEAADYGGGYLAGTVIGIPHGAAHPAAAWLLVKYLATNTNALVAMTRGLGNIPTTRASIADPRVRTSRQFSELIDIATSTHSRAIPGSPAGGATSEFVQSYLTQWTTSSARDPSPGLAATARRIDEQIDQVTGGVKGGPTG